MAEITPFETFDEAIIARYLTGAATAEEIEALRAWLAVEERNRKTFAEIRALWQRSRMESSADNSRFVRSLNALTRRVEQAERESHRRIRLSWGANMRRRVAVAASVAVVLISAIVYKMTLPEQFSAYNAGKTAMHLTLPDGSSVWLGERTRLTYDDRFAASIRRVKLDGEAYFDVVHDAEHPFVVNTSSINIRVLGTVFNVKAYRGQVVSEATLAEGSIALQDDRERNIVLLHPGQQAIYNSKEDALNINDVHVGNMLLIRYGVEELTDVPLPEIIDAIQSHFGVRLIPLEIIPNNHYNFSLQKNAPVEDVVELLQFVSGCHFKIIHTVQP